MSVGSTSFILQRRSRSVPEVLHTCRYLVQYWSLHLRTSAHEKAWHWDLACLSCTTTSKLQTQTQRHLLYAHPRERITSTTKVHFEHETAFRYTVPPVIRLVVSPAAAAAAAAYYVHVLNRLLDYAQYLNEIKESFRIEQKKSQIPFLSFPFLSFPFLSLSCLWTLLSNCMHAWMKIWMLYVHRRRRRRLRFSLYYYYYLVI